MFATLTTSRPAIRDAPRSRPGPPRKWYSLPAAGTPRSEITPSRFTVARSAPRRTRATDHHGYAVAVARDGLAHAFARRDVTRGGEHDRPHDEPADTDRGDRRSQPRPAACPPGRGAPISANRPCSPLFPVATRRPPTTSETGSSGPAQPATVSFAPGASQAGSVLWSEKGRAPSAAAARARRRPACRRRRGCRPRRRRHTRATPSRQRLNRATGRNFDGGARPPARHGSDGTARQASQIAAVARSSSPQAGVGRGSSTLGIAQSVQLRFTICSSHASFATLNAP